MQDMISLLQPGPIQRDPHYRTHSDHASGALLIRIKPNTGTFQPSLAESIPLEPSQAQPWQAQRHKALSN